MYAYIYVASELLLASSLFPLRKPSGKLRPIAIDEIFFRLVAKIAVRYGRVPGDLLPGNEEAMDHEHQLRQGTGQGSGSGRHVLVSGSEAIEASTFKLDLGVPVVNQLHEYFSSIPEPLLSKATQSVQAQFFHSLKKLCEAYVANPTSEILARILILPKLGLSSKLGAKSAPMAIRLMRALQDLTVSSLSASYCLALHHCLEKSSRPN